LSGITAIAAGASHTCALLTDGTVQCWGNNDNGQLGNGTMSMDGCSTPVAVSSLSGVTAIAAGGRLTCALLTGGTVQCWGDNYTTPVTVSGLSGVTAIDAGEHHTCALLMDRTVQCWGENEYGELGTGVSGMSTTPVAVKW
jgi:alpha-tubulin suppressor-like RCC1 family protein